MFFNSFNKLINFTSCSPNLLFNVLILSSSDNSTTFSTLLFKFNALFFSNLFLKIEDPILT